MESPEISYRNANPFAAVGHPTFCHPRTVWRNQKASDMSSTTSTQLVRTPANLSFVNVNGTTTGLADLVGLDGAVLFFMRTSSCPVCLHHLKELADIATEISSSGKSIVIVIPDGVQASAKLTKKYPTFQFVVGDAAADAQRNLGLGAKFGMQRSGVLIVDSSTVPVYEHAATMPIFAFDKKELLENLRPAAKR